MILSKGDMLVMGAKMVEAVNRWRLLGRKIDNYVNDLGRKAINQVKNNTILEVDEHIIKNLKAKIKQETGIKVVFDKADVRTLNNYIQFRKAHHAFSKEELEKIIDGVLTLEEKINVRNLKGMNTREKLSAIRIIKQDWNKTFPWRQSFNQTEKSMKLAILKRVY
jgi:hypothetical protein